MTKITYCPPGFAIGYVPQNGVGEMEAFAEDVANISLAAKRPDELKRFEKKRSRWNAGPTRWGKE